MPLKSNQSVDAPSLTPVAGGVPKAKPDGTIDAGWIPAGVGGSPAALEFVAAISGQALVGGDKLGNQRGEHALNIASGRLALDQVASGEWSIAIGYASKSSGESAIAIGNESVADGNWAVVIGPWASATFEEAVAIGDYAIVESYNGVAIGYGANVATGADSGIAVGVGAAVNAEGGIAIGPDTIAGAVRAVAIGRNVESNKAFLTAIPTPYLRSNPSLAGREAGNLGAPAAVLCTEDIDAVVNGARSFSILPKGVRFFADRLTVFAVVATGTNGTPSVRATGVSRTTTKTLLTGSVSTGNNVTMDVASSAGFAVGDWVVVEGFKDPLDLADTSAVPMGMAKITAIPGPTQLTFDQYYQSIVQFGWAYQFTKMTGTDGNVLAATATTGLTAVGKRWTSVAASITSSDGFEALVVSITGVATGTLYVRGMVHGVAAEVG